MPPLLTTTLHDFPPPTILDPFHHLIDLKLRMTSLHSATHRTHDPNPHLAFIGGVREYDASKAYETGVVSISSVLVSSVRMSECLPASISHLLLVFHLAFFVQTFTFYLVGIPTEKDPAS